MEAAMKESFPALLSSGKMGPWDLPNRIIMAPMGTLNADKDGYVTDRTLKFYSEQAKGGMALIIVECTYMDNDLSKGEDNCMGLYENGQITGMARLASVIHDHGVKAVLQLCHIGKQLALADQKASLGPSTMNEVMGGVMPFPIRGASKAEIRQIEADFASACWRAKMAGFDGVEIHGAINHLINMFCSPYYNHRTDEYGGSPENRVRFYREIIEACQKSCGKDFPLIARVNGNEFSPDGITAQEGIAQAKILEQTGVIAFHVVGGDYRNVRVINAQYDPRGDFISIARGFKEAGIRLPIILDGGFTTPDLAEKALAEGVCDYIGFGRPMLADPDWAVKLKEGRPEDIRPCIRCTMGCVGTIEKFNAAVGLRCSVNPRCNMAGLRELAPIGKKKHVCIIGGGPAGMEAALVLHQRGHDVTLYEKRKLGGTMHEAAFDPSFKSDILNLIHYYEVQLQKADIEVKYEEATAEKILAGNYDTVLVATGAPALPAAAAGRDKYPDKIMSLKDYAADPRPEKLGDSVLIAGGCFMNLETAYSLAKQGKTVIVSSRRGLSRGVMELGDDNSSPQQQRLMVVSAMTHRISYKLGCAFAEVTETGARLMNMKTKQPVEIACDSILLCRGYRGRPQLYEELKDKVETYLVGDAVLNSRCEDKRVIHHAIEDAWALANRI
jgi:2,4-dienoyl-CoA reductase-like NADH-dependent reductase (Old Yellow Enzyme family)/thioredoxin reductase